ncbi:MAG: helix-turn-helix transcriptional regulator [Sphingomonadaceae bacterium]|nr:helix-turn-helix transcriptional regulator [Sphingomonadaceae bacterium]
MTSFSNQAITPGFGFARARDKAFAAVRELWRLRREQGLSQSDLADRLDRDPAWVSRKLSGPSNWTLKTFGDLADALDGEVEIRLKDLKGASPINYDAYDAYSDHNLQRSSEVNQTGQTRSLNQLTDAP